MIFKDSYEDLSPIQLEHIIDRFASGKGSDVKPGPQIDRIYSAPVGGPTTLTDDIQPIRFNDTPAPAKTEETSVPPANAAKPVTDAPETDKSLKTPATAKKAAAENVKQKGDSADTARPSKRPLRRLSWTRRTVPSASSVRRRRTI